MVEDMTVKELYELCKQEIENGNESYTFIEADSKEMIESVLHHVQGMTTELIRYEEVEQNETENI